MSALGGLFARDGRLVSEPVRAPHLFVSPFGVTVGFDGRLDNRDDLAAHCSSGVQPPLTGACDAAHVSAAYQRFGDDFARHLNGDFAVAVMDARCRRLLLARDVMGSRNLYYCALPRTVIFATALAPLLAHPEVPTRPDEDGLADVVLEGFSSGHRTCFAGIHSVRPGHVVAVDGDTLTERPHWNFDPGKSIRFGAAVEYVDAFRSLFEQAVRRRLGSAHPVAVAVSGGLDSSSIFCQAAKLTESAGFNNVAQDFSPATAGLKTRTTLHGISMTFAAGTPADEQQFLDTIDRTTGGRIERLGFDRFRLLECACEVVRHQEAPHLPWNAQRLVPAHVRRAGCRVMLDGLFGDQLMAGRAFLIDRFRRGQWIAMRRDLRHMREWMTEVDPSHVLDTLRSDVMRSMLPRWVHRRGRRLLARSRSRRRYPAWYTPQFVARARDRAAARDDDRPSATLGKSRRAATRHAEEIHRSAMSGYYRLQQERRSRAASMAGVDVRYPFRDRDLIAFVMAIPGDVVNAGGIPKALLREAMTGTLPDAIRLRRWKADFTALNNQAARFELDAIRCLLTRDCLAAQAGWIDGDRIGAELAAIESALDSDADARPGWQVADAAALELWLQAFFDPVRSAATTSAPRVLERRAR